MICHVILQRVGTGKGLEQKCVWERNDLLRTACTSINYISFGCSSQLKIQCNASIMWFAQVNKALCLFYLRFYLSPYYIWFQKWQIPFISTPCFILRELWTNRHACIKWMRMRMKMVKIWVSLQNFLYFYRFMLDISFNP